MNALKSSGINIAGFFTWDSSLICKVNKHIKGLRIESIVPVVKNVQCLLTEWLTPHIKTLRRGSLERKIFTFWLMALNFFFFFIFVRLDILDALFFPVSEVLKPSKSFSKTEIPQSLDNVYILLNFGPSCRTINIPT